MTARCSIFGTRIAVAWLLLGVPVAGNADEVSLSFDGLELNGNLNTVGGSPGYVALLVHGTLAHKDMEVIASLQDIFGEYQQDSLAITLSLGVDDRQGFLPCDARHAHRYDDAVDEIGAWIDWLQDRGAAGVILVGHSRGANQVAKFVLEQPARVRGAVLLQTVTLGAVPPCSVALMVTAPTPLPTRPRRPPR